MKYSDCKELRRFCESLFSTPDWREVAENIEDQEDDFEVGGVRFIADSAIDDIQAEELGSDEYILGCFNAEFLAGVLGIDLDVIEAMQKAEAYEAIGKLVKSLGKLEELQQEYSAADGYGHHFNSYDFGEESITIDGREYHVFDNH
jgi:hypothetical protein